MSFLTAASAFLADFDRGDDVSDLNNYTDAIFCKDAVHWKAEMNSEIAFLKLNNTWKLVSHLNVKVLKGRWVYKTKSDLEENIVKYKAQWVMQGFLQKYSINYEETFASVVKSMTFKMLFEKVAVEDLKLKQMNMITAFLNSAVKSELQIYIEQLKDYEKNDNTVCLLQKTLYSLK